MKPADRPRILFVSLQSGHQSNGGLESATQIFEALRDDFSWHLVVNRPSKMTERWSELGSQVTIVRFDIGARSWRRYWALARLRMRLARLLVARPPSIVHANDSLAMQAVLGIAALTRAALLLTVRGTQRPDKAYGAHWRSAARRCRRIVVLSHEMIENLSGRIGADRAKFAVIESIVDLDRFHPRTEARANAPLAIGSIGVFASNKGQLGLLKQVAPALHDEGLDCAWHFYGDFEPVRDAYARRCAEAAEHLARGARPVFHGHVENLAEAFRSLDVVVIPSEREGLSRAMIEAMASGVPVVSFDVCSADEMLTATSAGIVVPDGDFAKMAEAVARLARDPSLREAMGRAGRETAERLFGAERARRAWLDLYGNLAQSARPSGRLVR